MYNTIYDDDISSDDAHHTIRHDIYNKNILYIGWDGIEWDDNKKDERFILDWFGSGVLHHYKYGSRYYLEWKLLYTHLC